MSKSFGEILTATRSSRPLIHSITNYVTANDCANMLFACGASPCMTDSEDEVADIVTIAGGLTVNLGTLNRERFKAMFLAGTEAVRLNKPIVFDPVGAGASKSRSASALEFLRSVRPTAIRGNASEIITLNNMLKGSAAQLVGFTRGVDSALESLDEASAAAVSLARLTGAVTVVTGAVDVVTDGVFVRYIENGDEMLTKITGSGCMMSSVMTAFLAGSPDEPLDAVTAAVGAVGVCGEMARDRMSEEDGNASFRTYLIDAMFNLDPDDLDERIDIREVKTNEDK